MLYLARSIIPQAKSYISEKQKLSIDLFVAKKILEKEHISIMQQFIDDFLFRGTEDVKVSELFEKYDFIDKAELFFPVLIQELTFLGQKVFAKRKDQTIYEEFTGMVDFLSSYSQRKR